MLGKTFRQLIRHGRLTIIRSDGDTEQFGELTAAEPRPDVTVRLKGALTPLKLALHPDLYFGELYVDGALLIERGTLWDLLELLGRNQVRQRSMPGHSVIGPWQAFLGWMRQGASRRAARRHVAHHYDLPQEHYRRFLDAAAPPSTARLAMPMATTAPDASDAAHSSAVSSTSAAGTTRSTSPMRERLLGAHVTAAPDQVLGLGRADEAGRALRAATAREDAELDLGEAEARRVGGDAQVARQRELEAAAEREPVDRRDHRPRDRGERVEPGADARADDAARRRRR